jgi:hypothetical protein
MADARVCGALGILKLRRRLGLVYARVELWGCFGGRYNFKMASNVGTLSENMNEESEINCSLKLSESDIPGATLTKPPVPWQF